MEASKKFLAGSKEFLNSNSFIAKISFIVFIIICFILLFNLSFWIMNMFLTPSRSPYLINGMKSAKTMKVIVQDIRQSDSTPIFRSRDQYNGIEMTWSTWIYIEDPTYQQTSSNTSYNVVFVKGSNASDLTNMGIMGRGDVGNTFSNSNAPGVYLQADEPVRKSTFNRQTNNYDLIKMNLIIFFDIFPFQDPNSGERIFRQQITIPGIPIRKWVCIIIRCSTQNIVDVFINGSLQQRVKLHNVIRQNYENVFINTDGGFDGFLSNLRYFDYSIGTFEINQIVSSGPNLRMDENTNLKSSNPLYLSTKWLFGETRG